MTKEKLGKERKVKWIERSSLLMLVLKDDKVDLSASWEILKHFLFLFRYELTAATVLSRKGIQLVNCFRMNFFLLTIPPKVIDLAFFDYTFQFTLWNDFFASPRNI